jgi:hypothetical protein
MVEYTAVAVVIIGLMFFLLEASIKLQGGKPAALGGNDPMNYIKLFLLCMSFLLGGAACALAYAVILENTGGAIIQDVGVAAIALWSTLTVVLVFGLLVYYVWLLPQYIKKGAEGSEED